MVSSDHGTRVQRAGNLSRYSTRQAFTIITEERSLSARVAAQIKVDVSTVLVRAGEAVLDAQRVAVGRAEVVDYTGRVSQGTDDYWRQAVRTLDDDARAGVGQRVAAGVCFADERPAGVAGGPDAGAGTNAV